MALQLTGAYKFSSIANLQVSLPAIVIGGGLTADRHGDRAPRVLPGANREGARALRGPRFRAALGSRHARDVRRQKNGRLSQSTWLTRELCGRRRRGRRRRDVEPDVQRLLDSWGGVTLVYRKALADVAGLPPESRRGQQEPRGGGALRREHVAGRGRARRSRARRGVKFRAGGRPSFSTYRRERSASPRGRART